MRSKLLQLVRQTGRSFVTCLPQRNYLGSAARVNKKVMSGARKGVSRH